MSTPVAPGVWVAHTRRPPPSGHPDDLAACADLPPWRQRDRLNARGLLRALLADVAPTAADAPLITAANGKPSLQGWSDIGVSMSHDGDVVAAAIALGRAVGVDVQLPPAEVGERMVRRCLRERFDDFARLPPEARATEFAWIWSVQEACVKVDGSGITGRPWAIDVPVRPLTGSWGSMTWVALRDHSDSPVSCAYGGALC